MKLRKISAFSWPILIALIGLIGIVVVALSPFTKASTTRATNTTDWKFWKYEHLKSLDPWGDSNGDARDVVAVYMKEEADTIHFRIDLMDLRSDSSQNVYFAIDYKAGGNTELVKDNQNFVSDISWDLLFVLHDSSKQAVFDTAYVDHPEYLTHAAVENQLDFVEFSIRKTAFAGWDGKPFQVQVIVTKNNFFTISDKTTPVSTNATTGRATLVLPFGNMLIGYGPDAISWYDGFRVNPEKRVGERRGAKYLLDALEKYELPLTIIQDLRVDLLPANDYLRINDRLRDLSNRGLLDALGHITYGYFMPWQPDDVDALAIQSARGYREAFGLPWSEVFYPYEAMLTAGDLAAIKEAGYPAIYALDRYGYWFGWITGLEPPTVIKEWFESRKKIHVINGLKIFFFNQGINWTDPRWGDIDWSTDLYMPTDQGLHLWWRRLLLDLAVDPDQEKYLQIGTDLGLTSWLYQDEAEWNAHWLASHPWIEATTFSDLLHRNWTPIDHGDLGLAPDQPLERYSGENDMHYNTYFWQFYYGGISDGHSPLIAKGDTIEGYFDYVPYLRGGQRIPSGRKMGDDKTPGTIVYETLRNLRAAPDNSLTRLAWLAYFMNIFEQTFHAQTLYKGGEEPKDDWGGKYLHPVSKIRANFTRQVNKIVAAAQWADEAAKGTLPDSAQLLIQDLDLDGEDEYVMKNKKVFTIFENDAGRMEYAFAYDPSVGPVQLVAPTYQVGLAHFGQTNYEEGESPLGHSPEETAFEEGEEYRYRVFDVALENRRLTFISPDGKIRKTFTLEGNTINAHYVTIDMGQVSVGFGLPVNLANMYSSHNWWEKIVKIWTPDAIGWQVANGGYAGVNFIDTRLNNAASFLDSPAREEMQEREDPSSYPVGHGNFFPYNTVTVTGNGEFDVSLTLSAKPPEAPQPTGVRVTNINDSGAGSLRQFILFANSHPGPDTIRFGIPTSDPGFNSELGVWTIKPITPLPAIQDGGLVIDGDSQARFIGTDTNPDGPEIQLDGSNLGPEDDGLILGGSDVEIIGLIISNFDRVGILFSDVNGGRISGCYIGTDAKGMASAPNGWGIWLLHRTRNFLIGPPDSTFRGNLISGGIWIADSCSHNVISGNMIGLNRMGTATLINNNDGIDFASHCDSNQVVNNRIGGNSRGVYIINSNGNLVGNNLIGTDSTWQLDLGNRSTGVSITDGSQGNIVRDNLIGYNGGSGVQVDGSETIRNRISRNGISKNGGTGIDDMNGGNTELAPPVILSATAAQVTGMAGAAQTVETYADESDEGRIFLGSTSTDSSGKFILSLSQPIPLPYLTAIAIDTLGNSSEFSSPFFTKVEGSPQLQLPKEFKVGLNYPNPFNPETVIQYQLPKAAEVRLDIYNIVGERVMTLVAEKQQAGYYTVRWNGTDESGQRVASAVYLYQLKVVDPATGGAGKFVAVKKMLVLR